jgi:hypothetical protein
MRRHTQGRPWNKCLHLQTVLLLLLLLVACGGRARAFEVRRKPSPAGPSALGIKAETQAREGMSSPTLKTRQDPILLLPWVCFRGQTLGGVEHPPVRPAEAEIRPHGTELGDRAGVQGGSQRPTGVAMPDAVQHATHLRLILCASLPRPLRQNNEWCVGHHPYLQPVPLPAVSPPSASPIPF